MLPDDEELRDLQHRAYARGGGLTDADARRLRELEDARRDVGHRAEAAAVREENARFGGGIGADAPPERANSSPAVDDAVADTSAAHAPGEPDAGRRAPAHPHQDDDGDTVAVSAPAREALRRHWLLVAAASAVLLAVGLGAGWMLFGRGVWPSTTPADQQDALAMIERRDFDAGSVRFVGEEHGVAVWQATTDGGASECIVVTREERQGSQCRVIGEAPEEYEFDGLTTSIEFEDDGEAIVVWASMILDIDGEPATIVQRSTMSAGSWESQYTPEELEAAEELEAEGFEIWDLQIVGYDGEIVVWQAQRTGETCLAAVVDGEVHLGCGDTNTIGERLRVRVGTTEYETLQTPNHGQMFSITRNAGGAANPLEVGGEHGDPIELAPEGTEP